MIRFDKYFLKDIEDCNSVSYVETFYFNYGVWQEIYDEGVFNYRNHSIKSGLIQKLKVYKKYLYNNKKYKNVIKVKVIDGYKEIEIDLKKYENFKIIISLKGDDSNVVHR